MTNPDQVIKTYMREDQKLDPGTGGEKFSKGDFSCPPGELAPFTAYTESKEAFRLFYEYYYRDSANVVRCEPPALTAYQAALKQVGKCISNDQLPAIYQTALDAVRTCTEGK